MGVYQKSSYDSDGMGLRQTDASLYGVNKFRASYSMFVSDSRTREQAAWKQRNGNVSSTPPPSNSVMLYEDNCSHMNGKTNGVSHDANSRHPIPEVTRRQITVNIPRMQIKSFSEAVMIPELKGQPDTRVVTQLEFKGDRRYKTHMEVRHGMRPEKYSETCYVHFNSTRKRYVNRLLVKPRIQNQSHSETVYSYPKVATVCYQTLLTPPPQDEAQNNIRFKTCINFQPRANSCHLLDTLSSVGNRCDGDYDATSNHHEYQRSSTCYNNGLQKILKSNISRIQNPSNISDVRPLNVENKLG